MYARHTLAALACAAVVTSTALADVTIEERVDLSAIGGFSMAAMEGTTVTRIAADRARTDSDMKFKSALMQRFAGKEAGPTAQLIRLDQEKIYEIDFGRKQYTEMSFADMRAMAAQAAEQVDAAVQEAEQVAAESPPSPVPVDEESCEWSEPQVEARKTGQSAVIAGLSAEQAIVRVTQTCTDRQSGKACDMSWSIEQWLSASVPGGDQAREFWLNFARRMGLDEAMAESTRARYQQVFSQYRNAWGDVMEKAGEFEGYPLKSVLAMEIGGPQCTTDDGRPVSESLVADAAEAGLQAGATSAASAATSVAAQKAAEEAGYGIGGSVAGSAVGAFGSKLASGLFNRKKKTEEPPAQAAAAPASVPLFRMMSETTSISEAPIDGSQFELPAGLTKTELSLASGT